MEAMNPGSYENGGVLHPGLVITTLEPGERVLTYADLQRLRSMSEPEDES
jgi:hypothetical protein